jgi:hypothetical protein
MLNNKINVIFIYRKLYLSNKGSFIVNCHYQFVYWNGKNMAATEVHYLWFKVVEGLIAGESQVYFVIHTFDLWLRGFLR